MNENNFHIYNQTKKTYFAYINLTHLNQVAISINLFWHVKNIRFHHASNVTEEKFTAIKIHIQLSRVLYKIIIQSYLILVHQIWIIKMK